MSEVVSLDRVRTRKRGSFIVKEGRKHIGSVEYWKEGDRRWFPPEVLKGRNRLWIANAIDCEIDVFDSPEAAEQAVRQHWEAFGRPALEREKAAKAQAKAAAEARQPAVRAQEESWLANLRWNWESVYGWRDSLEHDKRARVEAYVASLRWEG